MTIEPTVADADHAICSSSASVGRHDVLLASALFVVLVAALLGSAMAYTDVEEFCEDSKWDSTQPAFASFNAFWAERAQFLEFRDYFLQITSSVDLGNTTVEAGIIDLLNAKLTQKGFDNTVLSFTITRSNGDITIDSQLGVNPVIDNHGGRYSLGKPMLCRDFHTVVFDYTYVTRTGLQYRFWSQAVQTSVQKQFFAFRWNIPVQ
ncbi:uncharacterized protein ACA1_374400 [Acanthamoeba castellanii str. Neff]|uniref:Uncharacterized protein n=1 Tax=Acanthamoeba castellanii (strain ATCC 30010 / Neff) TaxID=1257118 RepID=L8GH94_ACACF|nr:uncharacterized protein ACA1_374400 [Acanthamoeba castellanii str. Neff]ELR12372.1 hypothetical protein ACA1_374400 [Acanthamoeba castellanii str. Neff]